MKRNVRLFGSLLILSAALLFFLRPARADGSFYYLDCNGSDSNLGTSEQSPWQTLAKASGFTYSPGDRLLLKKGCVWTGTLSISQSGTSLENIYVSSYSEGELPTIENNTSGGSSVTVRGSHITFENISTIAIAPAREIGCQNQAKGHITGFNFEPGASFNTVKNSKITGAYAGVFLRSGSHNNKILNNNIFGNIMMNPVDTAGGNDAGAFGVLLWGDDNEIAYNVLSGQDACSYDYGRDGADIEVYGGQRNNIHHNISSNSDAFTELGNSRSADNTFAYNQFSSNLAKSIFLVTRGGSSGFGPVNNTKVLNNTVYLTGPTSQGFVCHGGCSSSILKMRNNIIKAVGKAGYADNSFDEDYNIYQGQTQFTLGPNSRAVDPQFIDPMQGNFRLSSNSPAIDSGINDFLQIYNTDLEGKLLPIGTALDKGGYEFSSGVAATATPSPTGVPSPTPNQIIGSGDVNADGVVDGNDMAAVFSNWYATASSKYDQFKDNLVNSFDLGVVIKKVGNVYSTPSPTPTPSSSESFTFGAVGDHGAGSNAASVFKQIAPHNLDFFMSLGDLRYGQLSDQSWCKFVKDNINAGAGKSSGDPYGENYPFMIVSGGHENGVDNSGDGLIDNMVAPGCLPDRIGVIQSPNLGTNPSSIGNYAKEYYFDYPKDSPLARIIMVDPQQNFLHGGYYDFKVGGPRYNWLSQTIDEARARGIKWVIVGNHENYISTGIKSDEVGSDFFNLVISKKVDLLIQGHDHNYQRSKQLVLNPSTCTRISASSSTNTSCVADDGADGVYTKGQGTVMMVNGSGGIGFYATSVSDAQNGYFAKWMGNTTGTTGQRTNGYTKFKVSENEISGEFIRGSGGVFTDSFVIR